MEVIHGKNTGKCSPCSYDLGFCATCVRTSYQCTSCLDGYSLQGIKCVSNVKVVVILVLDTSLAGFVAFIEGFKNEFMTSLGPPYINRRQWMTFTVFIPGSLEV